jgi:azurin
MLRSAATVLLASAPLFAAVPAQAAQQQDFPCDVDLQKVDDDLTSTVTLALDCDETRTVGAHVVVGGTVADMQMTVQAGIRQTSTITVNRAPQICATLKTDDETTTVCAT